MIVSFHAGQTGPWVISSIQAVSGAGLAPADRLGITPPSANTNSECVWVLKGFTSNLRYTMKSERAALMVNYAPLDRPQAKCAALIPIRKTEAWWQLAQDERRYILEEQSKHIAIGLDYMPAVARRLHHSRDLGEPFDFLTWFEFAPEHEPLFNEMLMRLRQSAEWSYVEREVDIRLRLDI